MTFAFLDIQQHVTRPDGVGVMSATHWATDDGAFAHSLVFAPTDVDIAAVPGDGQTVVRQGRLGASPVMMVQSGLADHVAVQAEGKTVAIPSQPADFDFFAGMNVGLTVNNLESVETILDWLDYHATHHGMTAALIVCRQRAFLPKNFANKLKRQAKGIAGLERLMLWSIDMPLGKPDQPAEDHPLTVRGAPGKDRMEDPRPDPQRSPMGHFQVYELLHHAYLMRARAVMNLDVHDLLDITPDAQPNVFDLTYSSDTGLVALLGEQCFPWRIKPQKRVMFADHIYRRFDDERKAGRWCVRPEQSLSPPLWRVIRVVGRDAVPETRGFHRHMALKHPHPKVARLVPKSSLVIAPDLLHRATDLFSHEPEFMPVESVEDMGKKNGTCIITTMKNEGPFILEWVAYHRSIGVDRILVYTNDCTDGTDTFLELLQTKGYLQHRDNQFEGTGLKPQHNAFRLAEEEDILQSAEWIVCMDVDEYITIKTGDGTLSALYEAMGDANMVAMNWRLFGNNDVHLFEDRPIVEQFTRCAPEYCRKPHQAWGFKTLFRNTGIFKKLGVHRPKGLRPQLWDDIHWLNGSGKPMPKEMFRNAWRSTTETYGYDMVQLNHYAVRSAESFLVKRDRGRVNHVDRDQGLSYWFRMNNNAEPNFDIQPSVARMRAEIDKMLADPDIAAAHAYCVDQHRAKIEALKATPNYAAFYDTLTGARQERLAQMHHLFGANVFLAGPDVVPDDVVFADHEPGFFFTVEAQETTH